MFSKIKGIELYITQKKCELQTEIHGLIAGKTCQIKLSRKDIKLQDAAVILYGAGSCMAVEDKHINFTLSVDTYSINVFNKKNKAALYSKSKIGKRPRLKT